jgi:hypothetical protein
VCPQPGRQLPRGLRLRLRQPYQHFIDIKMPSPPDNGAGIFLHDYMAVGYTEGCVAPCPLPSLTPYSAG